MDRTENTRPFVSIVIPTFNRASLLTRCLKHLLMLDYPDDQFEIVVIDDGSEDGTRDSLRRNFDLAGDKIQYYRLENNSGAAAARNAGFSRAKGSLIASLDDDCLVEKDWLKNLIETFQRYPRACAVGGSVVNPTDSRLAQASHLIEFSDWLPLGAVRPVKNIPTCNIAYRKSEIEGFSFPEEFKGSVYEDTMFHWDLTEAGKKIIFDPGIKVFHYKWEGSFTKEDFYRSQARYATGFLRGGYKAHGIWGKILLRCRILNLTCPRLIFVFLRCARSKTYLCQFIRSFVWILRGEWFRNKIIYRGSD